jgi:hypothetical protein
MWVKRRIPMKMQSPIWAMAIVLTGLLTLGIAVPVQAQAPQTPPPQPPAQQTEFDSKQIQSFASAARKVQEIRTKWQPKMQEADNAEKMQELQMQANAEMVKALEETGLTVATYNAIATAAQENPQLAEQIAKLMEQ